MYRFWLEENYAKASPIKLNNHHDLEWMDLKDSGYLDMCKIGVPPIIRVLIFRVLIIHYIRYYTTMVLFFLH